MYCENMTAEHILRTQEAMDSQSHQFEGEDRASVRKVAVEVLKELGHRNEVDDIKWDNWQWQIGYEGKLPFKDRRTLEKLIAEQLQITAERVKLVGIGY